MKISLADAYQRLGLKPLDEFILDKLTENNPDKRGIGATTWMTVELARAVLAGKKAVLVGGTIAETSYLLQQSIRHINALGGVMVESTGRTFTCNSGGKFKVYNERSYKSIGFRSDEIVFRDLLWRSMALNRMEGPYEQIQTIIWNSVLEQFDAYDVTGEYLLSLSREGGVDILNKRIGIRIVASLDHI